jgi:hypothetical protein
MFDTYLDIMQSHGLKWFYGVTLGGGTLLLLFTGWLWWHYSYLNPQTVFWAAVNNNLIIDGVTRHTERQENGASHDRYDQISLGAHNMVKSVETITQTESANQKNVVASESIATPEANFSRYTKIETGSKTADGKPADFSKVINQWSKQELGQGVNGGFADAIFDVVPFAHLNASQRSEVVLDMQRDDTYGIDFTAVSKTRKNGRLYYSYDANIAPDKYIKLLKQVDAMIGLNQLKSLDPAQYQGSNAVQVKITVDAMAHQLSSVSYVGSTNMETYSAWGASRNDALPANTISQAALQAKLNAVVSGQ